MQKFRRSIQKSNQSTYRSKTHVKNSEAETSISTFSNVMEPKFIKDLKTKKIDVDSNTSINNFPISKEFKVFNKFKKKAKDSCQLLKIQKKINKAEKKSEEVKEKNLEKEHSRKKETAESEQGEDEGIEIEEESKYKDRLKNFQLPDIELTHFYSGQKHQKSYLDPQRFNKSGMSSFHEISPLLQKSNNSSSRPEEFSLRSFNEATASDNEMFNTLSSSSFENRMFSEEEAFLKKDRKNNKFKSLILLDDGKMKAVDMQDVLTLNQEHNGILKFRNLKSRKRVMKLKEVLGQVQEEEEEEHDHVHFGKYVKVYNFNPNKKVKRKGSKFVNNKKKEFS